MADETQSAETATTEASKGNEAEGLNDLGQLNDEITSMRHHISKLNEENKKHRLRAKEAQEEKINAMQENGEFKELASALQAKVEILERDLPSLTDKAHKFDQFQSQEAQRIEAAIESVPDSWKAVISNASDLNTKRQILEVLQTTKAAAPATQASAPSNNSKPSSAKEIAQAWVAANAQTKGLFNR